MKIKRKEAKMSGNLSVRASKDRSEPMNVDLGLDMPTLDAIKNFDFSHGNGVVITGRFIRLVIHRED